MSTATLFGIVLAPLYSAIAQVESEKGKMSHNIYQIDAHVGGTYIDDVNRIMIKNCKIEGVTYRMFVPIAKLDRRASERMMFVYWKHWGLHYAKKTGKPVTYEVLAMIHNGGPLGWKKQATVAYWKKVKNVLEHQTNDEIKSWSKGVSK